MRVPKWNEKLDAIFDEALGQRFIWGSHDCCQFAVRCVEAITGEEKLSLFARYDSEAGALGILWSLGGMRNLITYALGPSKPITFASPGDIVLIDMGLGEQPAVCMGLNSYAPGARRLECRPTLRGVAAWTV